MTLLHCMLGVAALLGAGEAYQWPLELPRQLTSSFAEYRQGRFHAGLDLRTAGTGKAVHAAAACHVARVSCAPRGYGKALYLKLDDGNTVVYAHLDGFYDELAQYVREAQHDAKSYTINLYPKAGRFPVAAGQVIARSGQTGIGAPHLHFEVRDAAQRPINPRTAGLTWPDAEPPRFNQLLVAPGGAGARVEGDVLPRVLSVRQTGPGRYVCDPVAVRGKVGFGVDLADPGSGGYRLGVHQLRLDAGGEECFRVQHDAFSYANNHHGAVAYHPFFLDEGRFLLLWRWPGNAMASFARSPGQGWVDVPDGAEITVVITAEDFHGNAATLEVSLRGGVDALRGSVDALRGSVDALRGVSESGKDGRGKAGLMCRGDAMVLSVRFNQPEGEAPAGRLFHDGAKEALPLLRTGENLFRAVLPATRPGRYTVQARHSRIDAFDAEFHVFVRGAAQPETVLAGLRFRVAPGSPFGTLFLRVERLDEAPRTPMKALGPMYRIGPEQTPIDKAVEISFPAPDGIEARARVHVYRKRGKAWDRMDTHWADGRLRISTRRFGVFAIMEDREAPSISAVSLEDGERLASRRPSIRATVADAGSGIDHIEVSCGGQWLLTAYDPERERIVWEQDENLPAGRQEITIAITDHAGNAKTLSRSVIVPE